ncbi:hypothetical protein GOV14_06490 [Candidatus Pacearchaeota archaeon]|nr:hypothetical protein [Candidatus Pacearchaeota archaeon]
MSKDSESGMLGKFIDFFKGRKGSLDDSIEQFYKSEDSSDSFLKTLCEYVSGERTLEETKHLDFSGPVAMFAGCAKIVEKYDPDRAMDCFEATMTKARDLVELDNNFSVSPQRIDEIMVCYAMGKLMHHGTPVLETILHIADNFQRIKERKDDESYKGNPEYAAEDALRYLNHAIRQGDTLEHPMEEKLFFSPLSVYLASIGEYTGDFDKTLMKSAELLELGSRTKMSPAEINEVAFYYAFGTLIDAGLSLERTFMMLQDGSKNYLIGPEANVFDGMINDAKGNVALETILEKQSSFSPDLVKRLADPNVPWEQELLKYSAELQEKYSKN